jgi:hypothetical protein
MIGYKLFRERKDGTIGSLFINRKAKLLLNKWLSSDNYPTKGFAERPGWHICKEPNAPHLSMKNRAWYKVEFVNAITLKRPESQGGIWYLSPNIKILEKL